MVRSLGVPGEFLGAAFFFLVLSSVWASGSAAESAKLSKYEVNALVQIAKKLNKTDWDFKVDPCSGGGNWTVPNPLKGRESAVVCDCSFKNNSVCHVVTVLLKGQNLSGTLPPEFARLRFLRQLDLSRNLLNGTIPVQWATLRLQGLSVMGNRLYGPFPKVLLKITSLTNLSIEGNLFAGPLPTELDKVTKLEKLVISSNNFSGELPASLTRLSNLTDLRLCDNSFSGRIPEFIGQLTKLDKLLIQGSSLEGPIPSSISALTRITDMYTMQMACVLISPFMLWFQMGVDDSSVEFTFPHAPYFSQQSFVV